MMASLPMHSAPIALLSSVCDAATRFDQSVDAKGIISDSVPSCCKISLIECRSRYWGLDGWPIVERITGRYLLILPAPARPRATAAVSGTCSDFTEKYLMNS